MLARHFLYGIFSFSYLILWRSNSPSIPLRRYRKKSKTTSEPRQRIQIFQNVLRKTVSVCVKIRRLDHPIRTAGALGSRLAVQSESLELWVLVFTSEFELRGSVILLRTFKESGHSEKCSDVFQQTRQTT